MKRLLLVVLALMTVLCGCGKKIIPPELTMASHIYHNEGTDFYPEDYCKIRSHSGGNVAVTYDGELDVNIKGDYKISVTADDEFGGVTSKDITVTVQENRSGLGNKVVCERLEEYINGLIDGGLSNVSYRGDAEGFGNMASAYSSDGKYEADGVAGELVFEVFQLEDERTSVFNAVLEVDEKAMWYIPQKVVLTAADESIEMAVSEGITENGKYGCYAVINEFGENSGEKHPDYAYVEKIRNIANYDGDITLKAVGTSGFYEMKLTEGQKKDFRDILEIYQEMLSYY